MIRPNDDEVEAAVGLLLRAAHDNRVRAVLALCASVMHDSGSNMAGAVMDLDGQKLALVCGAGHMADAVDAARQAITDTCERRGRDGYWTKRTIMPGK